MRQLRYFNLDGTSTETWNADVTGIGSYSKPSRSIELVSVPGRHGDLVYDNGRYDNVTIKYGCKIYRRSDVDSFREAYSDFSDFLASHQDSYYRLYDSYNPDYYRMAMVSGGLDPEIIENSKGSVYASFDVTMNCKPQRFLVNGMSYVAITSGQKITNPTRQIALPVIRVYCTGNGEVMIGNKSIVISPGSIAYIDIDCDLHTITEGTTNRSNIVQMPNGYPDLHPGENGITYSGDVTNIEIQPRWWML